MLWWHRGRRGRRQYTSEVISRRRGPCEKDSLCYLSPYRYHSDKETGCRRTRTRLRWWPQLGVDAAGSIDGCGSTGSVATGGARNIRTLCDSMRSSGQRMWRILQHTDQYGLPSGRPTAWSQCYRQYRRHSWPVDRPRLVLPRPRWLLYWRLQLRRLH